MVILRSEDGLFILRFHLEILGVVYFDTDLKGILAMPFCWKTLGIMFSVT